MSSSRYHAVWDSGGTSLGHTAACCVELRLELLRLGSPSALNLKNEFRALALMRSVARTPPVK